MNPADVKAVVTGGASGLGEATVKEIIKEGGKAAILDINNEKGEQLAEEIGEQALYINTDVTDEESVENAFAHVVDTFGHLNTVVNCAGIGSAEKTVGSKGPHDLQTFSKVVQINLIGSFNIIRLAAEQMMKNNENEEKERGVIINTASIAAFDGQIGQAAYSASKGGIVGMTLPIARDLSKHGIRVMTIAPGLFETPLFASLPEKAKNALGEMTPFPSRLGKAEEFARLAKSIVENSMLNGETIRLDGAVRMTPK
ncbi:NAD(P)-dependent dehydrogenase (short-subunit alcohol dehydrogenase family) [Geomicrobium halophilum]|uniref:NAD(P)-dependent dehydrogenase (Short-subunit alcohol dehydrogenase family) n=1 Tax=Geomicrobium halophilum TaxID=549000 RepID=A0A841PID1_9BACL|nr:3-hydroxyacyl-CoA dehydrogenase [Geomicrobium halophilum]MBB6448550.1 NAD(P)-dependent dehydrogenase (short-subunit alcohol dehydrogenase family) [Geomicrobium halophilum]